MSSTMKAWRLAAYNADPSAAIDSLTLEDVPVPSPAEGQLLIKVQYASLNPIDWKLFTGNYHANFPCQLPYTPGFDVAGTVTESSSPSFSPGDLVIADIGLQTSCKLPPPSPGGPAGALAQFAAVPADICVKLPAGTADLAKYAGLPLAGMTSFQALFTSAARSMTGATLGDVREGSKVLVLGAGGGTGMLAVQLAKSVGAFVACTASGKPMPGEVGVTKIEMCKRLGADVVVDYQNEDWSETLKGGEYDLIYDCVGIPEDLTEKAGKVLKKGAKFVSIANFAGKSTEDVNYEVFLTIPTATDLAKMAAMVAEGKLVVPVDTVFEFAQVKEALKKSLSATSSGKLIVKVD